ncbi:TetR/AcrR family transcriptional regulator [Conexibacter woesei]|uniref:Transcriptional regulator, TetR family n=1 Tax=Conexibacter woesei (strain DSM 14684 / CCUG 47730 / CIP 108061 / JCM 11494 / NBRC 100937 / ID131577) TaxID=469383 RepID=D3FBD4_CONWI|nr:TetR/AcrR family transcriptional regulator [Conexibacter woesei]ADB49303.1 transcriptional regulator, TetR family [Conexibacter woesei DSM 14684]
MGAKRTPRTKPGEERRSDLLDAAERVVVERGVDGLTIDDVTAGAGVAKGTFYLHFGSKDALIAALRERCVERVLRRQRDAAADAESGARVERWVLAGLDGYLDDAALVDVLFHAAGPGAVTTPEGAVRQLSRLIAEADPDAPDPRATAIVLYHALHGVADHLLGEPDDGERLRAELVRLCRALAGP